MVSWRTCPVCRRRRSGADSRDVGEVLSGTLRPGLQGGTGEEAAGDAAWLALETDHNCGPALSQGGGDIVFYLEEPVSRQ